MKLEQMVSRTAGSIQASAIRRFFDMASEMKGQVISLSIGEPDFVTPWSIRDAGIYSLEQGRTHYSPNAGYQAVREAIAQYMQNRFTLSYQARDEIMVTVGGSEAIDLMVRAVVNPGDEVIIPEPCFVAYDACVRLAGGIPVPVACLAENSFKLTSAQLAGAMTEKTKLLILGYPNNPTGAVLSKQDIAGLANVLSQRNVLVLSDELYAELYYGDGSYHSIAAEPGMQGRTVVVSGFSKAFAMTGWRIGYACGPAPLIAAMNKIHQYAIMCSPSTAQDAAVEALKNSVAHIAPMREEYNRRRRIVVHACRAAGLDCFEPLGAFYVFPDIRSTGLSSNLFCERFLQEEKVAIVPGNAFGESGEGYVRISYAASLENIQIAMQRLRRFVERSQKNAGIR